MNHLFINKMPVDRLFLAPYRWRAIFLKLQKAFILGLICFFFLQNSLQAQIIWSGPKIVFTKGSQDSPNLAENQDRITPNVWITRGAERGIFNIQQESEYIRDLSPADTEWAFGTTANLANLSFADWRTAINRNPLDMVNRDMVVHLISEDIYIDIKFLNWEQQAGGFSYERSTENAAAFAVESFSLVNISDNQVIGALEDDAIIDASNFPDGFGILANTNPQNVGSVQFFLNDILIRTENIAPYSYAADVSGVINPVDLTPGVYELRAVPFSESRGNGDEGNSLTINFEVIGGSQAVRELVLVDISNNQAVGSIQEGDVINISNFPDGFGIVANTNPAKVGSVQFFLDGIFTQNENIAPYSLAADENGVINPVNLAPGNYELRATPFSESRGNGDEGNSLTVNFEVINSVQSVRELVVVDVSNNQVVEVLTNGSIIDASNYPDGFGIVANTVPSNVGSVRFFLDGVFTQNENFAPYSFAADVNGVINPVNLSPGSYELTATPFTATNGNGTEGNSLIVNFEVIEGQAIGPVVRFLMIDTENEIVTLKNFGDEEMDISGYWLCLGPGAYNSMSNYTSITGDLNLSPNEEVTIDLSSGSQNVQALPDANGGLSLFASTAFSSNSPTVVKDYMQWGASNQNRVGQGVNAGRWSNVEDFVVGNPPYTYIGGAFDIGGEFWEGNLNTTLNAYPNPAPGRVNIKSSTLEQVIIKSAQGEMIYEGKLSQGITTFELNPGIYFVISGNETKRIIVQ